MNIETIKKAKQVIVRETVDEDTVYEFGAVQIGNILIAMDNGDILDANAPHITVLEELPWVSLSDELLGN